MLIQLVILHIFFFVASAKKTKTSELIQINDLKDWKKELRTKNNVLALFTKVKSKGINSTVCIIVPIIYYIYKDTILKL